MGSPKKLRKKYNTPSHLWEKGRIEEENRLQKEYGLKNKREIWKEKTKLKKYRQQARELVGLSGEERKTAENVLINKLQRLGVLKEGAGLDEILSLKIEDLLSRRLQTIVWKKALALTAKQARQFIVHGHISLKGQKVTAPGMTIKLEEEKEVDWYGKPIELQHPKQDTTLEVIEKEAKEDKQTTELEEKAAEKVIEKEQVIEEKQEQKEEKEAEEVAKEIEKKKGKGIKEVAEEIKPTEAEEKTTKKALKETAEKIIEKKEDKKTKPKKKTTSKKKLKSE